jgi:hypothetical protein
MSDLIKLIEKAKLYVPGGASFTGDLAERIRSLSTLAGEELSRIISTQVGDYVRTGSKDDIGISLAAPIGYDIWYLFPTTNVLNFEDNERTEEILERLNPFLSKLQDIKPLKTIRSVADLNFTTWWSWPASMNYWTNSAPYMIKVMRYETILEGRSFKYYSDGMPSNSVGYLAFPVGQLGVMEIVSLIGESVAEADDFSIDAQEAVVEAGGMMAPVHDNRSFCVGEHLIEGGYLVQNDGTNRVELMSEDFEGQESIEPHRWLRYWLMPEDTFPIPGEFVALLAKPELFHVWWFQETYPFLYSGQYWENEYYTSGIVQEIIEPGDESEEETNIYKIWIRGFEMWLRPTDFYLYEVDERVAIVKETLDLIDNMDWTLIESDKDNDSSSKDNPDEDWYIAPISFYEVE